MPAIACPKCQTKYQLPDSALGKAVKCKKCGATFKTASPQAPAQPTGAQPTGAQPRTAQQQPAGQATAQAGAPQASPQELAKLGIDGPLRRQGDIFAGTAPQPGNQLGNFALEDPGFGNYEIAQQEVEAEKADDGMSSIIDNPFATPKAFSRAGKRRAKPEVDVSGYGAAKVGMWIVYLAWGVMIGISGFFCVLYMLARMAPNLGEKFIETVGPTIAPIMAILITVFFLLWIVAVVAIFFGQIICIFSPNPDEKLFAGLAVGAIVGAVVAFFGMFFLGAVASATGSDSDAARAAVGLMSLIMVVVVYGLTLANLFLFIHYFKKVGQNIESKKVVKAAQTATMTWIGAIGIAIVSTIVLLVFATFLKPQSGEEAASYVLIITDMSMILNMSVWFAVTGTMMAMVRSALNALRR